MAIENDERLVSSAIKDAMEEGSKDSMEIKPVLSEEFRDAIEEVGGFDEKLVSSSTEDAMEEKTKGSKKIKPVLPQEFRDAIEKVGGFDAELAIEKRFSMIDTMSTFCRFTMRFKAVTKRKFFKNLGWKDFFSGLPVAVIDPSLNMTVMSLFKGYQNKYEVRKNDPFYVLVDSWDAVLKKNKLKAGDLMQIWMFKLNEGDDIDDPTLGFAFVRIADGGHDGEAQ